MLFPPSKGSQQGREESVVHVSLRTAMKQRKRKARAQQQVAGVGGRHYVKVLGHESGQRKVLARGDEQQATCRRDERLHLLRVPGVVHERNGPLVVKHGPVKAAHLRTFSNDAKGSSIR